MPPADSDRTYLPYGKFFWDDYAGDQELLLCSPGAQALWMRMLCIAAKADPVGHVLIQGQKPTTEQLVTITRFKPEDIETWLAELIAKGVPSIGRAGVMYNRRMIRDAKRHRISVKGGKNRQRQVAETKQQSSTGSRQVTQPPESRVQSPESRVGTDSRLDAVLGNAERLCRIIGVSLTEDTRRANWPMLINRMTDSGLDFECICEAAQEMRDRDRMPEEVRTPMLFERRAWDIQKTRGARAPATQTATLTLLPTSRVNLSRDQWVKAMETFLLIGAWLRSEWGPSPCERGCQVPADIQSAGKAHWQRQGNHPKVIQLGNGVVPWSTDPSKSLMPTPVPWFEAEAA